MLSFGQVEAALAKIHCVREDALPTFHGRIKHFQKIGLVTSSPGKGNRIQYGAYDLLFWAFAFELAQQGIDPTIIKALMPRIMPYFIDAIEIVDKTDVDIYLVICPVIMGAYVNKPEKLSFDEAGAVFILPSIEDHGDIVGEIKRRMTPKLPDAPNIYELYGRRLNLLNVTMLKRQLEAALAEVGAPNILHAVKFERIPNWVSPSGAR